MAKSFEIQMQTLLNQYSADVKKVVDESGQKIARDGAKKLRSTSPKSPHGGDYAQGWKSKKTPTGYVIYNAKKPGLAHLLENSHMIVNQYGTYGRTNGQPHIAPVNEWCNDEFQNQVKKKIEAIK